jgi:aminopeptidase
MTQQDRTRYAELLIAALGLKEGQNLRIKGEPVHWPLMTELAAVAYRAGARFVDVNSDHAALHKARVENSREEYLEYVPATVDAVQKVLVEEQWALISVKNMEDPDFYADLDQAKNGTVQRAVAHAQQPFRRAVQANKFQWLVCSWPTDPWARKILGPDATSEKLWEAMQPILRLDREDPVQAWWDHAAALDRRAEEFEKLGIDRLHFSGPDTDLTVGLPEKVHWLGGSAEADTGATFLPNLPTEEVFTTPDYRRTEGTVQVTRPVLVLGNLVEGATFTFREGKVVDYDARRGKESLDRYFQIDDNARYLGEIALVDAASPIYQSGLTFYDILLDENAANHFALGSAYPGGVHGGDALSEEEMTAAGINRSAVHTDFMFGSDDLTCTANLRDGSTREIMRGGRFTSQ